MAETVHTQMYYYKSLFTSVTSMVTCTKERIYLGPSKPDIIIVAYMRPVVHGKTHLAIIMSLTLKNILLLFDRL